MTSNLLITTKLYLLPIQKEVKEKMDAAALEEAKEESEMEEKDCNLTGPRKLKRQDSSDFEMDDHCSSNGKSNGNGVHCKKEVLNGPVSKKNGNISSSTGTINVNSDSAKDRSAILTRRKSQPNVTNTFKKPQTCEPLGKLIKTT